MKKIILVSLVAILILLGIAMNAKGEEATLELLRAVKTFTVKGQIEGTWILSLEKDESGYYTCALDLHDGRVITVPLTEDELNELLYQALEEAHQQAEAETAKNEPVQQTWTAKVVDWVTFWD